MEYRRYPELKLIDDYIYDPKDRWKYTMNKTHSIALCEIFNLPIIVIRITYLKYIYSHRSTTRLGVGLPCGAIYQPWSCTIYDKNTIRDKAHDFLTSGGMIRLASNTVDVNIEKEYPSFDKFPEWFKYYTSNTDLRQWVDTSKEEILSNYTYLNNFLNLQHEDGTYLFNEDVRRMAKIAINTNHRI